ncbi:uncharacterized protein [Nerophis lumbriciformis]|uniref:uncharacterized protein n=1 Tax=Nerophis lumbriciformis TaxID=546530 RepID=UPI002ADF857F|nr:zinc finger protein 27 [Nerophis lumbriciformis]
MMLGLQGNSSPSKIYHCVACSASFSGLASLLVHQATHANTLPKVNTPTTTQPDMSPHDTLTASQNSSSEAHSPPVSLYICDCGKEFHDFSLMLEHKQLHVSQAQRPQTPDGTVLPGALEADNGLTENVTPSPKIDFVPSTQSTSESSLVQREPVSSCLSTIGSSLVQEEFVPSCSSTSGSSLVQQEFVPSCPSTLGSSLVQEEHTANERLEERDAVPGTPPQEYQTAPKIGEQCDQTLATSDPINTKVENPPLEYQTAPEIGEQYYQTLATSDSINAKVENPLQEYQTAPAIGEQCDQTLAKSDTINAKVENPLQEYQTAPEIGEQCDQTLATSDPINAKVENVEEEKSQDMQKPVVSGDEGNLASKDKVMKLLASAYMKCNSVSPCPNENNEFITLKQEAIPVDITDITPVQIPGPQPEPINDLSVAKMRRLLAEPGIKTKAPTISKIIDCSRKKIVSLTKVLSPVVVLETRQKLRDSSNNGLFGKYQCGRCRRTFPNSDRLTEHHFLHKKERIKCCRRCKQLIIGKLPFTDNHVCTPSGKKSDQLSSTLPLAPKIMPFHGLNNTKKSFYCPVCKHNYARRYNLKKHKCQGPKTAPIQVSNCTTDRMLALRSSSKAVPLRDDRFQLSRNMCVSTDVPGPIKVEVTSTTSEQSYISDMAWSGFAKSFPPFMPTHSMRDQHSVMENSHLDAASVHNDSSNEGQWTMPLDDEAELLSPSMNAFNDLNPGESESDAMANQSYIVSDGVQRYPCHRCQKTYSRLSTLERHLLLCGSRPQGPGTVSPSSGGGQWMASQNSGTKPMYPCFVCGRTFNRKDNMMAHRRKCQLQQHTNQQLVQPILSGGAKDSSDNDANNWGIMSLPSVLPRRVTCECGVGFTSPRLLLEHLQKHAQESYTCPTCGETVNSWSDYEVHLQIHMHPHHQLLKGIHTQRSQPLVLRIQQQPPQQQPPTPPVHQPPTPLVHQPPQKQPVPVRASVGKKQRSVCARCGNSFASRCSLRRHLAWNRCKGSRPQTVPKTYRCSRCSSEFPNMVSLLFHQRSGACKPAIKPVRCPVCLRWFGTVDTLQRHLLTHKQSESHRCDICNGTYPSLKSLKNHRRRIHRIMATNVTHQSQELLT